MKLENKKALVARTLDVGKGRVMFNNQRLNEVKEAITKQDIRDLVASGAIIIREMKGRKKVVRRTSRRNAGSRRKTINGKKSEYVRVTRKLRAYLAGLKRKEKITPENFAKLRREIRARVFSNVSQLKERLAIL